VPHACATAGAGAIRIGHASGTIMVDAPVDMQGRVQHASVFRTARRLFQGEVLVPICKG
jgi:2-methylaconitate cis-trans-isomerase PrpF